MMDQDIRNKDANDKEYVENEVTLTSDGEESVNQTSKDGTDTKQKETITGSVKEKVKNTAKNAILGKIYSLVLTIVIIALVYFFFRWNPFGWNLNFFSGGFAKIDKTENVVDEVKRISEFTTACFYQEMVIRNTKEVKKDGGILNSLAKATHLDDGKDFVENEVVLIVKGKVRAGFNLHKVKKENFIIKSDSLSITVPKAEILDVIINPSDYEVYVEDGKWSHEEIVKLETEVEALFRQQALNDNILDKANTFGIEKLKTLFKSFGFSYVAINIE